MVKTRETVFFRRRKIPSIDRTVMWSLPYFSYSIVVSLTSSHIFPISGQL
jgi:hypothetical protein